MSQETLPRGTLPEMRNTCDTMPVNGRVNRILGRVSVESQALHMHITSASALFGGQGMFIRLDERHTQELGGGSLGVTQIVGATIGKVMSNLLTYARSVTASPHCHRASLSCTGSQMAPDHCLYRCIAQYSSVFSNHHLESCGIGSRDSSLEVRLVSINKHLRS